MCKYIGNDYYEEPQLIREPEEISEDIRCLRRLISDASEKLKALEGAREDIYTLISQKNSPIIHEFFEDILERIDELYFDIEGLKDEMAALKEELEDAVWYTGR